MEHHTIMSFTVTEDEKRAIGLAYDETQTSDAIRDRKAAFAKEIQDRIKAKKEKSL